MFIDLKVWRTGQSWIRFAADCSFYSKILKICSYKNFQINKKMPHTQQSLLEFILVSAVCKVAQYTSTNTQTIASIYMAFTFACEQEQKPRLAVQQPISKYVQCLIVHRKRNSPIKAGTILFGTCTSITFILVVLTILSSFSSSFLKI